MEENISWYKLLNMDHLLTLQKPTNYYHGFVTHHTKDGLGNKVQIYKESIGTLRSWQHKESRRSNVQNLQECILLQISGGFLYDGMRYFVNTIIHEDIGLANPNLILSIYPIFQKIKKFPLPLSKNHLVALINDNLNIAEMMARSLKSRFVASCATIALLANFYKPWTSIKSWSDRLKDLSQSIDECQRQSLYITELRKIVLEEGEDVQNNNKDEKEINNDDVIQMDEDENESKENEENEKKTQSEKHNFDASLIQNTCNILEDCLLCIPDKKKDAIVSGITGLKSSHQEIWTILLQMAHKDIKSIISMLQSIYFDLDDSRLVIYHALLLVVVAPSSLPLSVPDAIRIPQSLSQPLDPSFKIDLFSNGLPKTPDYAKDKHTKGGSGGYEKFQKEGILVPDENHWMMGLDNKISDFSFELRYQYEARSKIKGSSKSAQVREAILKPYTKLSNIPLDDKDLVQKVAEVFKRKPEKIKQKKVLSKKAKSVTAATKMNLPRLTDMIVAQAVTSAWKNYVYLTKDANGNPIVIKGPYRMDDLGSKARYDLNFKAYKCISIVDQLRWLDASVLEPKEWVSPESLATEKSTGALATENKDSTDKDSNEKWIYWPNIGNVSKLSTEIRSTKLAENVKIAERNSFVQRISDISPKELTRKIMLDTLNHLYARYIFNIGDSGPWNVLKGANGNVYGIDLEESRSEAKEAPESKMELLVTRKIKDVEKWQKVIPEVTELSVEIVQDYIAKNPESKTYFSKQVLDRIVRYKNCPR